MKPFAQLIAVLFVVGFVLAYWWIIVLIVAAVVAIKLAPIAYRRYQAGVIAEQRRQAALVARADQQHEWTLAGDPRGTYGD
jgi:mannose/fructose/N-acetylgalactosamine-specific phosphotransferase system component IIC